MPDGGVPVVGVVSAGEMGSALGRALRDGGARVVTTVAGRSPRSARLASEAGLDVLPDLAAVLGVADVVLSVVPPSQAGSLAAEVAELYARAGTRPGQAPVFADLNAISPGAMVAIAGAAPALDVVDGALSGAPPGTGSSATRLVLCGPSAQVVADLPWSTSVTTIVLAGGLGAASAAKMCTGAVRKGMSALVINALLTAEAHGVLGQVQEELRRTIGRDPVVDAELAASKAWRFVAEMEAVAETQDGAGLDPSLYRAIAGVFDRTSHSPLAGRRPEDVLRSPATGADGSDGDGLNGAEDARRSRIVAALRPGADQ